MANFQFPNFDETILKWPDRLGTAENPLPAEANSEPLIPFKSLGLTFLTAEEQAKREPTEAIKSILRVPVGLEDEPRRKFIMASQELCAGARLEIKDEKKSIVEYFSKVRKQEERAKKDRQYLCREYKLLRKKIELWRESIAEIEKEFGLIREKKASILSKVEALDRTEKYLRDELDACEALDVCRKIKRILDDDNDAASRIRTANRVAGIIILDGDDDAVSGIRTSSPIDERGTRPSFSNLVKEVAAVQDEEPNASIAQVSDVIWIEDDADEVSVSEVPLEVHEGNVQSSFVKLVKEAVVVRAEDVSDLDKVVGMSKDSMSLPRVENELAVKKEDPDGSFCSHHADEERENGKKAATMTDAATMTE